MIADDVGNIAAVVIAVDVSMIAEIVITVDVSSIYFCCCSHFVWKMKPNIQRSGLFT